MRVNFFPKCLMGRLNIQTLFLFFLFCAISAASKGQTIIGDQVDYAAPLNYRIAGISVVGSEYTDVQAIKLFSGLQEGDEVTIPGDAITDAVRKLWKQRLFTDIGIYAAEFRGNDVYLVISLKESPRMTKYVINGIKKSEADNLREKLDLRTMTISTENVKNNAIKTIKDYYIDKGHYAATVKISEREDPTLQNGVILEFDVNKGDRVKIEEIIIEGAGIAQENGDFLFLKSKKKRPVMSVSAIKRTMKDTKERDWSHIFKSSKFIEEKYEEDKQKIIAKYNKKGFRNAKIAYDSVYTINNERVGIYMKIEEDKRFYFRKIDFVGNTKYTSGRLDSVLNNFTYLCKNYQI